MRVAVEVATLPVVRPALTEEMTRHATQAPDLRSDKEGRAPGQLRPTWR